jgi:hypothetical protein
MDDLRRIIARILDGQRPAQSQPRGRPLQLFHGAEEIVRLQEPLGGTVEQDRYQWDGATAKWGSAKWVEESAISIIQRAGGTTWNGAGSRWGLGKWG